MKVFQGAHMLRQGSSRGVLSKHGLHLHNPFVETTHIGIEKPCTGMTFPFHLMNWIGIIWVKQCFVADFPSHLHHLEFWKFHLVLHKDICFCIIEILLNNKINKSVISSNVTWGSFILMSLQNNSSQETLYFYMHVWVKNQLLSHFFG